MHSVNSVMKITKDIVTYGTYVQPYVSFFDPSLPIPGIHYKSSLKQKWQNNKNHSHLTVMW